MHGPLPSSPLHSRTVGMGQGKAGCPAARLPLAGARRLCSERKGRRRAARRAASMLTPSRRLPITLRGRNSYSDSPSRADCASAGVAT